ncbi:BACON domain-containing protein [Embleya scabrispora]|uniref:BACON domain-containing protein n=1 Tax=Embleya scabrispora TaxID=159449 RepID=UPI001319F7C7|nr:hypothetical protein [Embleya scabrispora]MYS81295.1 hypothetical protein [Streptomyces sp. SID5474]
MAGGDVAGQGSGTADVTGAAPDAVALYDAHGDALFGFCVALGYEPGVAARAVRATLAAAPERIRALREPSRARALLYGLARVECAREAVDRRGPGVVEQVLAAGGAVWSVPDRQRLVPLVRYALWAVDEVERIVLDLSVRHRLRDRELADVLALSERRVERALSRAGEQFEHALAVYAVATHARRDCPELALLLPDAGAAVEASLRQPLYLHVDSCPDCVALRPGEVDARAVLAAAVPPAAPYSIRTELFAAGTSGAGGPVDRSGFPKGMGRPRSRVPVVVGGAVAVALVLGLAVLVRPGDGDAGSPVARGSAQAPDQPVIIHPPEVPTHAPSVAPSRPTGSSAPTAVPSTRAGSAKPTARSSRSAKPPAAGPASAAGLPANRPRSMETTQGNPAPRGTLAWSRTSVDLDAGGAAQTVRLTATGGPVTWSVAVSENDWLTVSPNSGTLANGQSISITISANADSAPTAAWAVTLSAQPTGVSLVVHGASRRVDVR